MSGWILKEERDTIKANQQDFALRAFVGPPREQVRQAQLQAGSPLDVSGITKLTADLTQSDITATVESTLGFPQNGGFFVGTEFIEYTGTTTTTFTNLRREDTQQHDSNAPVRQFAEITNRVFRVAANGSIDAHEWTATVEGEDYDHRLLKPDRSIYIEHQYFPVFGHEGARVGDGFSTVDGTASAELFGLEDADENSVEPTGMDWSPTGTLWVCTANDKIIEVNYHSGEVLATLTHSITSLEGLAIGSGNSLWVISQSLIGDSTIYELDRTSGNTISSFEVGIQPSALAYDGTYLYMTDLDSLVIRKYDTAGVQQWSVSGPDPVPGGMAYWDGDLWVVGVNTQRLYRIDRNTGDLYSIKELSVASPQALALSWFGGRIGSGGDNKIYNLGVGAREGRQGDKKVITLTEKFTAGANIVGASWGPTGNLWVALDSDVIAELNPGDGTVISSFSSPVIGMTSISHDGGTHVWVGASTLLYKIDTGPQDISASFNIASTANGLAHVQGELWVLGADGTIYEYLTDGTLVQTFAREFSDPQALAHFNSRLYVVDSTKMYVLDDLHAGVQQIYDIPTTTDPRGLAIDPNHGNRIGDGTDGKVYQLTFTTSPDERENTGGWSKWLPLYFGYIEEGSINVDHLEKTWNIRCRSTWMYFGDKEADGRNLAPNNIALFKAVRCSSVLTDPALEIPTEYISIPGEGVSGNNIVDDDLTTVWISQDEPHMDEGKDPLPGPVYGCPQNEIATGTLRGASNAGDAQLQLSVLVTFYPDTESILSPGDIDQFPDQSWIVIEKGQPNEEYIFYSKRQDIVFVSDPPQFDEAVLTNFLDADGNPTTLQKSHVVGSAVSARGVEVCGHNAPNITIGGASCFSKVPYARQGLTGNGAGTGVQFPLWPGEGVDAAGQLGRRLIINEIYKPRLGLRPELSWWIEFRNMSDQNQANIKAGNDFRKSIEGDPGRIGQGFLVIKWRDLEGTDKAVNIPLVRLTNDQHITIGPWPLQPESNRVPTPTNPCEKGWLVICGDRTEFSRWWSVPDGVAVLGLRKITDNFDGTTNPPPGGNPISLDFTHGEIKVYWQNTPWQYAGGDDADGLNSGALLDFDIPASATEIQVRNINLYPDYGWGYIHEPADDTQPYEWITWSGRRETNLPYPSGGGFAVGVLENVTRGYEGTITREWTGRLPTYPGALGAVVGNIARVIVAAPLPPEPGATDFGDGNFKLSDWVKFSGDIGGYQNQLPRAKAGHSYARDPDNNWQWVEDKVPQPGERQRTQRPEWCSVDLGEISPPTLRLGLAADSSHVSLTGDTGNLTNSGVILVDQEFIKYDVLDRSAAAVAPTTTGELTSLTRGFDGSSPAAHNPDTQVFQVFNRRALVEHLISGVSWQRRPNASDGIPTHYRIYTAWRPSPLYPGQTGWEEDWDLIWLVSGNDRKARGHFIQEFADLDSGANEARPPSTLGFHAARHVMMVIDQTDSGRAKINEFGVYSTNPRVNLLGGSVDRETGEDDEVNDMQNTISVFFDYVVRGFGMDPQEVVVIGNGVNFFELPIASGSYQSILSALADSTGYKIWFNRFNQLFMVPNPATRRSMPILTDLDATMLREPLQIISRPSARVSQVTVTFRDDLTDETFSVSYPEQPRGLGNPLSFNSVIVASTDEAEEIARQKYLEANGQWEVAGRFGVGHHFILGHRYTITYDAWEASQTYFQGQSFYVAAMSFDISTGPERRWDTNVTFREYHLSV